MKSITSRKPIEEITNYLGSAHKLFVVGCGTCPTLIHTGGIEQVEELARELDGDSRKVTGSMVVPVACEPLPQDARREFTDKMHGAEAVIVMSCAYGVRNISDVATIATLPALDTMFMGRESEPGLFMEECRQCGQCVLGLTGGICPIARCAKSLFNGPCGGSVGGKCEIDPGVPCGWQDIYERLKTLGRVDLMEEIIPFHDWSFSWSGGPRMYSLNGDKES